jgi:hypothetical protein
MLTSEEWEMKVQEANQWSQQSAMIIGEQKCGTTYLHTLLNSHSAIQQARKDQHFWRKEQHFWNSKASFGSTLGSAAVYTKVMSYQRRFESGKIALDSTPDYFDSPVARERIKKYAPHAKMILLLRNPATRAKAAWDQNRRAGWENRTFGQAVVDELE